MAIFPTSYFPNIQYFKNLSNFDEFFIEIFEHFPKQTYRNRCEILGANGILTLIVPVEKGRTGKTFTRDIKITYSENWQRQHYQSIRSAYASAPFYDYYMPEFERVFSRKFQYLIELNQEILQITNKILSFDKKISYTIDFDKNTDNQTFDFRVNFKPAKNELKIFSESSYIQVFSDRFEFKPNLSILDLIFNLGPESRTFVLK